MTSETILPAINSQTSKSKKASSETHLNQNITSFSAEGDVEKQVATTEKNNQVDIFNAESQKISDIRDDMIPEELLYSLSNTHYVVGKKRSQQLAPLKDTKSEEQLKAIAKKGPPSSLWHHKGRRTHFKHLIDNPRSMGKGVGTRDVSFLYDVVHQHEPSPPSLSKLDKSSVRIEAVEGKTSSKIAVPDTIIPEEYHMVKTKAVLGLEYIDEKTATLAKDPDDTLRVFPSLNPNKRFEVIQLLQTLEAMLEESGVHDDSVEVKGPTQIHNLLELIKKEQNIYDLVFSEVIRQVSVQCVERGQLLSQLRQSYAELLNRIPRQIQSLHAEVMAQRSLDRRLTEELVRFKSSISYLTKELQAVREHDHHVTTEAQMAEEELAKALKESQTNANLVDEYHSLYELQRKRLEASVNDLTIERDLWSNAAYNLSLKITNLNSLNTAKRLHVSEKAWSRLANHFIVMLNDHDSECLAEMQQHVEKWRSVMFQFKQDLEVADKRTVELLQQARNGLEKWMQQYEDILIEHQADVRIIKEPPKDFVEGLCNFFKSCEEEMGDNGERFAGGMLLSNEERIQIMMEECNAWTEIAWDIYRRHKVNGDEPFPLCEKMKEVNLLFHNLSKQLQVRFSGENGVARGMMNIQNSFDTWINKLTLQMLGSDSLTDSEWMVLYDRMADYVSMITQVIDLIGSQQLDDDRVNNVPHNHISVEDTMKAVHEWMKSTVTDIEAEDGKLMAKVSNIHIDLVRWMVQMLLNLVPNYDRSRKGSMIEPSMATTWTVNELVKNSHSVSQHLTNFTEYATECCSQIVQATMQKKRDRGDDDAENEYTDFLRVKMEAAEWIRSCEFLLSSIVSKPVSLLTSEMTSQLQISSAEQEGAEKTSKPTKSPVSSRESKSRGSSQAVNGEDLISRAQRTTKGGGKPSDLEDSRSDLASSGSYRDPKKRPSQDQGSASKLTPSDSSVTAPFEKPPSSPATAQTAQDAFPAPGTPPRSPGMPLIRKTTDAVPVTTPAVQATTHRASSPGALALTSDERPAATLETTSGPVASIVGLTQLPGTPKTAVKEDEVAASSSVLDTPSASDVNTSEPKAEEKMSTVEKGRRNVQIVDEEETTLGSEAENAEDVETESLSKVTSKKSKFTKEGKGKKTVPKGKKSKKLKEEDAGTTTEEDDKAQQEDEEKQQQVDDVEAQKVLQEQLTEQLDNIQKAFTDSKPDVIQYQKLGEDENIHLATLEDPENPLDPDSLVHPTSSLMRAAYEAIAKMDSLQKELVDTEIRAQNAEKQTIDLQEEVNEANQKIRSLEKTIKALEAARATPTSPADDEPADIKKALDISDKPNSAGKSTKPQSPSLDSGKRKGVKGSPKPKKPAGSKKK